MVGTLLLFGAMPDHLGFFKDKFMYLYVLIPVSGALTLPSLSIQGVAQGFTISQPTLVWFGWPSVVLF